MGRGALPRASGDLLVVTGGHRLDERVFKDFVETLPALRRFTLSSEEFSECRTQPEDVVLFYDMVGTRFDDGLWEKLGERYVGRLCAFAAAGSGMLFLNHSLFSCQPWPGFRQFVGGAFILDSGNDLGFPVSGYAADVVQRLSCVMPQHPIAAGLGEGFDIVDEVYLRMPWFPAAATPLFVSDFPFTRAASLPGDQRHLRPGWRPEDWDHPDGSPVVAWLSAVGQSPVFATTMGDGPGALNNPSFRQLMANATLWVGSDDARRWAQAQAVAVPSGLR